MWTGFSEWAKNMIFVSSANAHQRVPSAEDNCHHQMDRMTCSVYASQPLSPVTPVIVQRPHEQSAHGGRDEGYTGMKVMKMRLIDVHFHSPRPTRLWPPPSAPPACTRD